MTLQSLENDTIDARDDDTLLEICNLTISVPGVAGHVDVVRDLSLSVREGETVALVGESGCGKTMTALSVLRLLPAAVDIRNGTIQFLGRDVRGMTVGELRAYRGREVAIVFQEPMSSLNPVFTIGAQIENIIRLHENMTRRRLRERAGELLELVGIQDADRRLSSFAHELSGGMQQRALIAMALASRPTLLIADEPTTALDVTIKAQIAELLESLREKLDMSMLLITHDLGLVARLADRVAVMYAGEIVETGSASEVITSPRHPYTEGLVSTIPSQESRGSRLPELPGQVPQPEDRIEGCQFAPRCHKVMPCCHTTAPLAEVLSSTHSVFCHAITKDASE